MPHAPSFVRTDNAIMYAFIQLLKLKSFEKITVQDILDKTPVTRGTFYAHYQDKYEIAEKMLEKFLRQRNEVRAEIMKIDTKKFPMLRSFSESHQELIQALLKIHTESVDLRQALVNEFEQEYLSLNHGETADVEARIFAQARAELEFAIYEDPINITLVRSSEILQNVADRLLALVGTRKKFDIAGKV